MKKSVTVLMSTYNGEQYLEEQIESVFGQIGVDVRILVRDDGSTDKTITILNKYSNNSNFSWYSGPNLGAAYSFLDLLNRKIETEFIALCDQDDFWLPEKLVSSICFFKGDITPQLYFSKKIISDKDLNLLYEEDTLPGTLTIPICLFKSLGSGCTMVMNQPLKSIINSYIPEYIQMHDSWIIILAIIFGEVYYDPNAKILYRIHEDNVVGIDSKTTLWQDRVKYLYKKEIIEKPRSHTVSELLKGYKESISDKKTLNLLNSINDINKSIIARFNLIFSKNKYSFSFIDNLVIRIKILFGWI